MPANKHSQLVNDVFQCQKVDTDNKKFDKGLSNYRLPVSTAWSSSARHDHVMLPVQSQG